MPNTERKERGVATAELVQLWICQQLRGNKNRQTKTVHEHVLTNSFTIDEVPYSFQVQVTCWSFVFTWALFVKIERRQQLFTSNNTKHKTRWGSSANKSKRLHFGGWWKDGREAVWDQRYQPLDLSRAEPAVMLLRLSFSSFWSGIKRWLKHSSGFGGRLTRKL